MPDTLAFLILALCCVGAPTSFALAIREGIRTHNAENGDN